MTKQRAWIRPVIYTHDHLRAQPAVGPMHTPNTYLYRVRRELETLLDYRAIRSVYVDLDRIRR